MIPIILALLLDPFMISAAAGTTSTVELPVSADLRVSNPLTIVATSSDSVTLRINPRTPPGEYEAYLYVLDEITNTDVRTGVGVRIDVHVTEIHAQEISLTTNSTWWLWALLSTGVLVLMSLFVYVKKRF